jgi:hypothetical protein
MSEIAKSPLNEKSRVSAPKNFCNIYVIRLNPVFCSNDDTVGESVTNA